jgi:hypothetical protein
VVDDGRVPANRRGRVFHCDDGAWLWGALFLFICAESEINFKHFLIEYIQSKTVKDCKYSYATDSNAQVLVSFNMINLFIVVIHNGYSDTKVLQVCHTISCKRLRPLC